MASDERWARFLVSLLVVVGIVYSPFYDTDFFNVVIIIALAQISTAVLGWDPVKYWTARSAKFLPFKRDEGNNTPF